MLLHSFGHASWLLESSELRVALDPLLFERHAGGVFEVVPRRRVDAHALRADFVLVSHAHFDHFDVESLGTLARIDPDTVVVTSDELVAKAASLLGFRTVRTIGPGMRIELAGLSMVTTPSCAPDVEWGTVFCDETGAIWNMIDTVFQSAADVRRARRAAIGDRKLDLALAPIQTLREIALCTAEHVGFRVGDHAHAIACAAATEATTIAPSACGEAFVAPFRAMNHYVYPVSRARAARDLERYCPGTKTVIPQLGQALVVDHGEVCVVESSIPIERLGDGEDPRRFRPLEPAALVDPNFDDRNPREMADSIRAWGRTVLGPALHRELGGRTDLAGVVMVLEVVLPDDRLFLRFETDGSMTLDDDPEYDVLTQVAGSMLLDVIEGKRGWVEPLLAGLLRSSLRGADVSRGRCDPLQIAMMFPYYAIPYRASVERAVMNRARRFVASLP